jgi:hypothetical protein
VRKGEREREVERERERGGMKEKLGCLSVREKEEA